MGNPDAITINGKAVADASNVTAGGSSPFKDVCGLWVGTFLPNKIYRLRIISMTGLVTLNIGIQEHSMTVVEADGAYVEPFEVNSIDITNGQRYSVLLRTDKPSGAYWISTSGRGRSGIPRGLAVFK